MGKVLLHAMVSIDGFFEGPDHDLSWHCVDEELHRHFNEHLQGMRAFLNGRVSWELMAEFWPYADDDPDSPELMAEYAAIWRDMPQLVYTRTLTEVGWNAEIRREVDADEVRALAAEGDVAVGGADLGATFLRAGLVDECWLYVNPVVVGAGRWLFPDGLRLDLDLLQERTFGNGVVLLRYGLSPKVTA